MKSPVSLFLTLSLLVCVGCIHQRGRGESPAVTTIKKLDSKGRVEAAYTVYKDSDGHEIKHGAYVGFYPSGAKLFEITYKHGRPHGKSCSFTEEGKEVEVGWFHHGKAWEGDIKIGEFTWRFHKGKALGVWTETGFVHASLPPECIDMDFH